MSVCEEIMSTVSSELLATYAGLGTYDGAQYYRGEECHGELSHPD